MADTKVFNVWAGGVEVNAYPVSIDVAEDIKDYLEKDGYDDIQIEEVETWPSLNRRD